MSAIPKSAITKGFARAAYKASESAVSGGQRLADVAPPDVVEDVFRCALKKQTGVSLKYMLDFGAKPLNRQLLISAHFLHKELPVRLAHRVAELENLPYGLSNKKHVLRVRDWYIESFKDLRSFGPVKDAQDELAFTKMLQSIYRRHANTVPTIARSIFELKQELSVQGLVGLNELPEIHQFMDGFYMSRIGIRMLIGQHLALHEKDPPPNHIGLINTKCSPIQVVRNAVGDARSICMREYGEAPEVTIYGDEEFRFPYVPSHLHHMVFELVKNSLRAVQDRFEDSDDVAPNIMVVVAEGGEDVTIKIADQGGGIKRSGLSRIWTYLYTTARSPPPLNDDDEESNDADPVVLAGYGYGLPLSRLYARYFGGDMQIISMDGYGTDAYLHLNKIGNSQEPLP